MTFCGDFRFELGIEIGDWDLGMGLEIRIGDWEWRLGLGIGNLDLGLGMGIRFEIGDQDVWDLGWD